MQAYQDNLERGSPHVDRVVREILAGRPLLEIPTGTRRIPGADGRVDPQSVDYELDMIDVTSIFRGLPLGDQQMDWILGTMVQYHRLPTKCVVFSSHFAPCLSPEARDGRYASVLGEHVRKYHEFAYESCKRGGQTQETEGGISFLSLDKILVPFYVGNCHWCLVLIQPTVSRVIELFDPCGIDGPQREDVDVYTRSLLEYCRAQETIGNGSTEEKPWSLSNYDGLVDPDVGESGVYVCEYARAILTGCDPSKVKPGSTRKTRMEMATLALELMVCEEHP